MPANRYDLLIIGGGISGAALLYCATRYSSLKRIGLVEKYAEPAMVNSAGTHNSQTLHCGDIETNYTLEKALSVQKAAAMVVNYATHVAKPDNMLFRFPKMVLGVGEAEIEQLRERFNTFAPHFPTQRWLDKADIGRWEPNIVKGEHGARPEPLAACGAENDYCAVDFAALARSFFHQARQTDPGLKLHMNTRVLSIRRHEDIFRVTTTAGMLETASLVVSAGGHSLLLAQEMGYGCDYSCLPVAGSFYYTPKVLNGKVYTIQNDKLPFAAIHGDPDVLATDKTRFGPTALVLPVLERYQPETILDFFRLVGFDSTILKAMLNLVRDADIRRYILRNILFEIPLVRRHLFLRDAQKIVPSLRLEDVRFARRIGGIRPQLIDKRTNQIMLGEAKIDDGNGIIFNMTPSPGASSCLDHAQRDLRSLTHYLNAEFDAARFQEDLAG